MGAASEWALPSQLSACRQPWITSQRGDRRPDHTGTRIWPDPLVEAAEADAPFLEGRDEVDEVPQGPRQPVESPNDEGCRLTGGGRGPAQAASLGPGAGGVLHEDPVAARGGELVHLEVGVSGRPSTPGRSRGSGSCGM